MTNNQKPLSTDEIKRYEFDGLCHFKKKCDDLGIKYYLAFGTLLGAVRHKGFIPWDDDVDILIPRKDYNWMMDNYKLFENEDWHIVSNRSDHRYCLLWPKLCNKKTIVLPSRFNTGMTYGLSIDLFPLDFANVSDIEAASSIIKDVRTYYNSRMKKIQARAITRTSSIKDIIQRATRKVYFDTVGKLFGNPTQIIKDTEKYIAQKCSGGGYAMYAYDRYCKAWNAEDFGINEKEETYLEFEGENFRVPKNYDAILRRSYNDFMKLPPKEKQVTIHSFNAFII